MADDFHFELGFLDGAMPQTEWTDVVEGSKNSREALERLCRMYWHPVHAYIRRLGHTETDDLTQGFFAEILGSDFLDKVDRERGRFRNYIAGALGRYLARAKRDAGRQKRGGGAVHVVLEPEFLESEYPALIDTDLSPEEVFHRRWKHTVLLLAQRQLRENLAEKKRARFDALAPLLRRAPEPGEYAALAESLGESEQSLRQAVKRLRSAYVDVVRYQVGRTTWGTGELEAELAELSGPGQE